MEDHKLGTMEARFADLIWKWEPVSSGDLVKLCQMEFQWKKSTTYTMLRRLCDRGIFENRGGRVRALMQKEDFCALKSQRFVEETFDGSLPRFLAAFTRRKALTPQEVEEIRQMIDEYGEE